MQYHGQSIGGWRSGGTWRHSWGTRAPAFWRRKRRCKGELRAVLLYDIMLREREKAIERVCAIASVR